MGTEYAASVNYHIHKYIHNSISTWIFSNFMKMYLFVLQKLGGVNEETLSFRLVLSIFWKSLKPFEI